MIRLVLIVLLLFPSLSLAGQSSMAGMMGMWAAGGGSLTEVDKTSVSGFCQQTPSSTSNIGNSATNLGVATVFVPTENILLSEVSVTLARTTATTTNTVSVQIYADDGGTPKANLPTGSALATSTTTIAQEDLTTTATAYAFDFDGTVTLSSGTKYWLSVKIANGTTAYILLSRSSSCTTDQELQATWSGSAWSQLGTFNGTSPVGVKGLE